MESQSGLQMLRPRIWGAWRAPAAACEGRGDRHAPGQQLHGPLPDRAAGRARRGLHGAELRYAGNDTLLLMERVIQDLGAGVEFLRAQGYHKVVLIGNSGGAALAAFYQAQVERSPPTEFAHGDATHLSPADLPPVDGLALCAAHEGRSRLLSRWIDPSVTDERDPLASDPALDLYGDVVNGRLTTTTFLARFAAAQAARLARIEAWVERSAGHAARGPRRRFAGRRPGVHDPPHACRPALPGPAPGRERPRAGQRLGRRRRR